MEGDVFYDWRDMPGEQLRSIFGGWDKGDDYHDGLMEKCASLQVGKTALDIGCGLAHLYEALKGRIERYVGVDNNPRILRMVRERYPELEIVAADIYDLSKLPVFGTTYAVGLYQLQPRRKEGILEMLKHTKNCVVMTYYPEEAGRVPPALDIEGATCEFIGHDLDEKRASRSEFPHQELVRLWKGAVGNVAGK